ncbi:NAD(P)-binding domain-containing protein [Spongiimicrobium salis]|uniref:NAD(P)-binding domain-containing protein n=1 Tax=Spongiimicrobium salis TaxID=1667022 RepID=UPI00374DB669
MKIKHLIIGAGPGGIQLGYYLSKRNEEYILIEKSNKAGSFFQTMPRHNTLISINKVYTGFDDYEINQRWDWNSLLTEKEDEPFLFKKYSEEYFPKANLYVDYLNDFVENYGINVSYNTTVLNVSKNEDNLFVVTTDKETYYAEKVICATGKSKSYVPNFEGVELAETYEKFDIDPKKYTNKRVMIVGKGNSALETADSLVEHAAVIHLISPNPIRLAWKTHYVGHVRAVNNNFLDTYQLKSQNTILDADIEKVELLENGKKRVHFTYNHAEGQKLALDVDYLILCTGFMFDDTIFKGGNCKIEISDCGKFPKMTSEWESTTVKDLYFMGVLTHFRDYQKSFSGFIHGFRYNAKCFDQILKSKEENSEFQYTNFKFDVESFIQKFIDRVNQDSAMFQQPSFIGDIYVLNKSDDQISLIKSIPVDYFRDKKCEEKIYFQATMEYGKLDGIVDPFNIYRYPEDGGKSAFIHPICRLYHGSDLIEEYHLPEDLENNWDNEMYIGPFRNFLQGVWSHNILDASVIG